MTHDEIKAEFDKFIEFPDGSPRTEVTVTSTLLFAEHIAALVAAAEREACAKVCDIKAEVIAITGKSCDPDDLAAAIRARNTP